VLALVAYAWGLVVPAAAGAASVPSIDQVYARAARSLTRAGRVYHSIITPVGGAGNTTRLEWWVDVGRDVARGQQQLEAGSPSTHPILIADGGLYEVPAIRPGRALRCHGAPASVGAVLGCPGPTERSETTVTRAEHEGRRVIVLTTTGSRSAEDSETAFTRHLYLDAKTFLPVAADESGTVNAGTVRRYTIRARYRNGFVAASSLPADFFDPAALGFTAPGSTDLLRTLPPGTTLYWLGTTFEPDANLPASTLAKVELGGPEYVAILYYALSSDRFGLPDLSIQMWPRAAWDDPHHRFNFTPCPNGSPITLDGGGTATIYCDPNSPVAVVTYPDTVLLLGFRFYDNTGETVKPYANTDAITVVLHALKRTST